MRTLLYAMFAFSLTASFRPVLAAEKPAAAKTLQPDPEYIRKMIPTKITGTYRCGELVVLRFRDCNAYAVKPTDPVDPQRRWVWIFPFWLGISTTEAKSSMSPSLC
jgi:hypothetical protein